MACQLQPLLFTFHLKTLDLSSTPSFLTCSIRSSRARRICNSAEKPHENRRSGLQAGRAAAGGRGKSLIEDEAGLGDCVHYLKADSFPFGSTSGDNETLKRDVRDNRSSSLSNRRFDSDLDEGEKERVWRSSRSSNGLKKARSSSGVSEIRLKSSFSEEKSPFRQRREKGVSSGFVKRLGRGAESSFKQGRKSILEMSEEAEEEIDDFIVDKLDNKKVGTRGWSMKNIDSAELGSRDSEEQVARSYTGDDDSYLSNTRFDQCSISSSTLKGVKAAGYERMTLVQEATLPIILEGKDVLAKAKTGTGKTVAFLLPAIEIVSKLPIGGRDQRRPPITVLVVCPTRELADQVATEANTLLKFYPSVCVQVVIGGTRLTLEQKRMQANPCQILVATPGRLKDHIENTPGFAARLMGVKVLVLDEADRLLDMGFRRDIEHIIASVPKQRQTLLFSATVPDEVRQICHIAMKKDHEFVSTVEEGSEETHSQVRQTHLIAPLEKQFPILYILLTDHIAEDVDYKVIVFCTTAMMTKLVAELLSALGLNVREIHSRKPQGYRTRVSKEFRESKGLILVSSDVSARGVDYPDITLVVQVGVPAGREQYIHRLGRTGRQGKEGKGILLLAPWEEFFLSSIKDLPVAKGPMTLADKSSEKKVEMALGNVEMKSKESAYQAWLGYYNSNKTIGRDKNKLVVLANEFSRSMGLDNPPAITKLVLRKMGLNNVPGLRAK